MPNAIEDPFRSAFAALAAKQKRFAIGAVVARGGARPLVLVSGQRHRHSTEPVGLAAPWHIGSITKSFTASLVMRLVDHGCLALDQPLETLLPAEAEAMHPRWRDITLRQALSHTAGLPANLPMLELLRPGGQDLAAERLTRLRKLWADPPGGAVGQFLYSNVGYLLAGLVVEAASGRPWEELIVTEVAKPLGLSSLGFGAPTAADSAWGHRKRFGLSFAKNPRAAGADNPAWMGPAGTLHLNLADLAVWGQIHLAACRDERPEFLSGESCRVLRSPVATEYGLGWVVQSLPDRPETLVWANGSNTFWYAILGMVPERDLVLAVALNRFDQQGGDAALRALLTAVLGKL